MAFIGRKPTNAPLVSSDLGIGIVGSTNIADGTIVNADINASAAIASTKLSGAGKVLQVVQTSKTDTFTTASTSFTDVTGLSVSITPSSASNKILITFQINGSQDVGVNRSSLRMLRDSTVINAGAVAGSRSPALGGFSSDNNTIPSAPVSGIFLDSPATTSSITYKIQIGCLAGNGTAFINRTDDDGDEAGQIRMASNLVAIEIAG